MATRSSFRRSRAAPGRGTRVWPSMALRPLTLKTTPPGVNRNARDAASRLRGFRCGFWADFLFVPRGDGSATPWAGSCSLEGGDHRRERNIELRAEARKRSDDGDRHAGCDQRVFDGGRTAFLAYEARKKHFHDPGTPPAIGHAASQSSSRFDIVAQFAKIVRNSPFSAP